MCIKKIINFKAYSGTDTKNTQKDLESFQENGSGKLTSLDSVSTDMTAPSLEREPLFGKHGLPGTSDTRKAQSLVPLVACAPPRPVYFRLGL